MMGIFCEIILGIQLNENDYKEVYLEKTYNHNYPEEWMYNPKDGTPLWERTEVDLEDKITNSRLVDRNITIDCRKPNSLRDDGIIIVGKTLWDSGNLMEDGEMFKDLDNIIEEKNKHIDEVKFYLKKFNIHLEPKLFVLNNIG